MKFISLFSGIGGLDLGLERAGMECVAQVEIDDFCQKVLVKHWPNVPKFKDVRDVGKHNLPTADLICGGFSCQPHSICGKRKASADERNLWPEFARIIRDCQPNWVLAENVPGLLSSENGRFFGRVLADLAASGYCVEWQSLSASSFGAPHIRERVFFVAYHESIRKLQISISSRQPQQESTYIDGLCEPLSNSKHYPLLFYQHRQDIHTSGHGQWSIEPDVGRMVYGVPNRVDRNKSLGNSVVPQIAEFIGRCILRAQI